MTTPTGVIFGSSGSTSTLTLANGGSWASLGYTVGQGIYVGSSGLNGNGSSFTGGNYYTIASINGDVITLQSGENLQSETTANLAPVTINGVNSTLTPVITSANVNFGNNADGMGTITLTVERDCRGRELECVYGRRRHLCPGHRHQRERCVVHAERRRLLSDRRDQRRDHHADAGADRGG